MAKSRGKGKLTNTRLAGISKPVRICSLTTSHLLIAHGLSTVDGCLGNVDGKEKNRGRDVDKPCNLRFGPKIGEILWHWKLGPSSRPAFRSSSILTTSIFHFKDSPRHQSSTKPSLAALQYL